MNQEDAVKTFLKDHFEDLTDSNLTLERLKQIEREYFVHKHRNKYKKPRPREIIRGLYIFMLRRGLSAEVIADCIENLPIFQFSGESLVLELMDELTRPDARTAIAKPDIDAIWKVGAYEAAKQAIGKEVREEKLKELSDIEEQIQQKMEEHNKLPSILDYEEIPEPVFDPEVEEIRPWWERFYLKGNPFPRKDGLSNIAEELYEDILVKTRPFQSTLSALNKDNAFLFDTAFLLAGDYGYGKTTFMDYLSYYILENFKIIPIRITCAKAHSDSMGFLNDFYLKLRNALRRENDPIGNRMPSDIGNDLDIDEQIIQLALRLTQEKRKGIVVFLDDYHKHRSYFPHIFEFLGLLQVIKDSLSRSSAKVGFIVSGKADWKQELLINGQMAGFLDNSPIEMPDITPELVCDVFNQRIKAYCFDKSPRTLKLDFVKLIFKQIEGKSGFRDYLTRITTELENNNLSIIDTPVDIPEETLRCIKAKLEQDKALLSSLNKLNLTSRFKNYNTEQIAKCYELLVLLHIHDGIRESDKLFMENKYYFAQLRDVTLIQKRKLKGNVLQWVLHSRLQSAIDAIRERWGYGPSDYLLKIYAWKTSSNQCFASSDTASSSTLSETKRYLNRELNLPKSAKDNIEQAFRTFDTITSEELSRSSIRQMAVRGQNALSSLSRAFFEIDRTQVFYQRVGITDLSHQWQLHWIEDDSIAEAFTRFNNFEATPEDDQSAALALRQVKDVFPALAERLREVVEDMFSGKSHDLRTRSLYHTSDELRTFERVIEEQYSPQGSIHFNYVKRITDYLELRFRAFLYATTALLFGDDYVNHLPEQTRKYAYHSLQGRSMYSSFVNAFDGFTRPQFRNVFRQGGVIKDAVIDQLSMNWQGADWDKFFDVFIEENIATSHQQLASYDVIARPAYIKYCSMMEEITVSINTLLSGIVNRHSYVISDYNPETGQKEQKVQFAFKMQKNSSENSSKRYNNSDMPTEVGEFLRKANSILHPISPVNHASVMSSIRQKLDLDPFGCLVIDISNIEYIINTYGVPWPSFICSLALALHAEESLLIDQWFGSSLLIRQR